MLVLTNPDLPDSTVPSGKGGVGFRLYKNTTRQLAPLIKFNSRARYSTADPVDIPTLSPNYGGLFFQQSIGFTITSLIQASTTTVSFRVLSDPLSATLGTIWSDLSTLSIYIDPETTVEEGDTLAIICEIESPLEEPTDNETTLDIPDGFIVSSVISAGLTFTAAANPSSPVAGNYVQSDTTLTLYTGTGFNLPLGTRATVRGIYTIELSAPLGVGLSFDLFEYNLETVDAVEFLGTSYIETTTPEKPSLKQFIWNSPMLTVFAASEVGRRLIKPATATNAINYGGTTTYTQIEKVG